MEQGRSGRNSQWTSIRGADFGLHSQFCAIQFKRVFLCLTGFVLSKWQPAMTNWSQHGYSKKVCCTQTIFSPSFLLYPGPPTDPLRESCHVHTWSCSFARKQQATVNCILLFFQDISEFDSSKCMYPFSNPSNSSEVPGGKGSQHFSCVDSSCADVGQESVSLQELCHTAVLHVEQVSLSGELQGIAKNEVQQKSWKLSYIHTLRWWSCVTCVHVVETKESVSRFCDEHYLSENLRLVVHAFSVLVKVASIVLVLSRCGTLWAFQYLHRTTETDACTCQMLPTWWTPYWAPTTLTASWSQFHLIYQLHIDRPPLSNVRCETEDMRLSESPCDKLPSDMGGRGLARNA